MWQIHGLGGEGKWHNFGTCDVKLSEKTVTLENIKSDRIIGKKVRCSRDWAKEIKDEDFEAGEFVWYYQKTGMPYRFTKILCTEKKESQ